MTAYSPPNLNLDIFNTKNFAFATPTALTLSGSYVAFPIAQGDVTLQGVTINGDLTLQGAVFDILDALINLGDNSQIIFNSLIPTYSNALGYVNSSYTAVNLTAFDTATTKNVATIVMEHVGVYVISYTYSPFVATNSHMDSWEVGMGVNATDMTLGGFHSTNITSTNSLITPKLTQSFIYTNTTASQTLYLNVQITSNNIHYTNDGATILISSVKIA